MGTAGLAVLGVIIAAGLGEAILIAAAVLIASVAIVAFAPGSGVAAVLLAVPTMFHLYPMPRGSFSLLELAILVSAAGTGILVLMRMPKNGWSDLRSLLTPAEIVVPVAALLVATALALLNLADPTYRSESLREVRTVIVEPLIFLATARIVMRDRIARWWAAAALVGGGAAISIAAIIQVLGGFGGVEAGTIVRATVTYTHPNNLSFYLERTLLFSAALLFLRPRWWPAWVLCGVQAAGLGLTFSRGAFLAVAVGLAFLLLFHGMRRAILGLLAGGIVFGVLAVLIAPDRLIDAGGSGSEPTRFAIWRSSLRMVRDHPIFGVGPDQFLYQYLRRYVEPEGWAERYTSHPHNLVLDVWLRLGVLGLAAFAALFVGVANLVRRSMAHLRNDPFATGALAALFGGLAHAMVDNGFFLADLATMTWFFVLCLATVSPTEEEA
jgi:O-antigen ligase